jgi:hypothetical protein
MVVNYGVRPIGSLAAGVLASGMGIRSTLWIATVGGPLRVLWLLGSPLRRLHGPPAEREGEDA